MEVTDPPVLPQLSFHESLIEILFDRIFKQDCRVLANIKLALATRRLNQADLAVRVGISPTAMSEVIHERRIPDPRLRARIAQELATDENWLFSSLIEIPGRQVSKSGT